MTIAEQRTAIAEALSTVDDVTGYKFQPGHPKVGDGWPMLPKWQLAHGLVWQPEWTVVIVLPSDDVKASEWVEEHFLAIAEALRVPGFPTEAEMAQMQTDGGPLLVLEFTTKSE